MGKRRRHRSRDRFWMQQYGGMPVWGLVLALVFIVPTGLVSLAVAAQREPVDYSRQPQVTPGPLNEQWAANDATKVAFFGDSYTAGAGVSVRTARWTSVVSSNFGWSEENGALGGTGYIKVAEPGECGLDYCGAVPETIETSDLDAPSFVVLSAGRNDGAKLVDGADAVAAAIAEARLKWPAATVVVTNPLWDDDPEPDYFSAAVDATKTEAEAAGATYLDLSQPLSGNAELISEDGIHPNDDGHAAIAAAFIEAWEAASPAPPAAPSVAPVLDLRFGDLGDGELPASASGLDLLTLDNDGVSEPFFVADGLLQHGAPTAANSASYLESPIGKDVERLGAEAVFGGDSSGSVALIVWSESLTANPIPTAGIHFVANPNAWHISYWDDGEENYAEGTFDAPLERGVPHSFEITRSASSVWITLPDQSTVGPFTHEQIEPLSSEWASWELYESEPTQTPAAFRRVWAG